MVKRKIWTCLLLCIAIMFQSVSVRAEIGSEWKNVVSKLSAGQAQAYANEIEKLQRENSVYFADLIDFNGDGNPELYVICQKEEQGDYGETQTFDIEHIFCWKGTNAIPVSLEDLGTNSGRFGGSSKSVINSNGKYLLMKSGNYWSGTLGTCILWEFDGSAFKEVLYIEQNMYDSYPNNLFIIREKGKEAATGDLGDPDTVDVELSPVPKVKEYLSKYNLASAVGFNKSDVSGLLSALRTTANTGGKSKSAQDILKDIAYIGDISKCKMSAEQAKAFAEVLAKTEDGSGIVWNQKTDRQEKLATVAFLVDACGDGIPLLVIIKRNEFFDNGEIWEYVDGKAVRFIDDGIIEEGIAQREEPLVAGIYTWKGTPYFYTATWTNSFGETEALILYSRDKGKLTKAHSFTRKTFDEYTMPQNIKLKTPEEIKNSGIIEVAGEGFKVWTKFTMDGKIVSPEIFSTTPFEAIFNNWFSDGNHMIWVMGSNGASTTGGAFPGEIISQIRKTQFILEAYAAAGGMGGYIYPAVKASLTEAQIKSIAEALAARLGGEITEIYKLADDLYYVVIKLNNGNSGGAIVREGRKGGKPDFRVIQSDEKLLSQDELAPYISAEAANPNVAVDYGKTSGFKSADDYSNYLKEILQNVDGTAPNDAAKEAITAYIENAVSRVSSKPVKAQKNQVLIKASDIVDIIKSGGDTKAALEGVLKENNVTLNKPVTIIVRIEGQNIGMSEPCQITLDSSLAEQLNGCTLLILLGNGNYAVQITEEDFKALQSSYGDIVIQLAKTSEKMFTIAFVDKDGKTIDKLTAPMTFILPAESELSTVRMSHAGGTENWGGQYDKANGSIRFSTIYSGQYEVLDNDISISDIGELADDVQEAIKYMVSKGFFALEGDAFNPSGALTRYSFTETLVRIFFALDRELETSFTDVPQDIQYYPFVASAEKDRIVAGYNDGTFRGDNNLTREQMIAIAVRTLASRKGYSYPENPNDYLNFIDKDEISDWALKEIALAARENLIPIGGLLEPKREITRAEAAEILYKLFNLLYETSPVPIVMEAVSFEEESAKPTAETFETAPVEAQPEEKSGSPVLPIAAGAAAVLAIGGGAVYYFKRKDGSSAGKEHVAPNEPKEPKGE